MVKKIKNDIEWYTRFAGFLGILTVCSVAASCNSSTLSEVSTQELVSRLDKVRGDETLTILEEISSRGEEGYKQVLQYADAHLSSGRLYNWPELLLYLTGILDRTTDLLVLRVLDLDLPEETKLQALLLLKEHINSEAWILRKQIRGKVAEFPMTLRGGTKPIFYEGRFLSVEDVLEIKHKAESIAVNNGQTERLRQHAAEIVALIEYKDAQAWLARRYVRLVEDGYASAEELSLDAAKERAENEPIVQAAQKRWEEEQARTAALEARIVENKGGRTTSAPAEEGVAWWVWILVVSVSLAGMGGFYLTVRRRRAR